MTDDAVLTRLAARAAAATTAAAAAAAALQNYLETGVAAPEADLVSLKDAEAEFGKSNKQLRRWATEEDLGALVNGKWHLSRSLVRLHKNVRTCLPTMSK